jgi:hypothetical protein
MGNLDDDLRQYSDEFFTRGDLKAGFKLIGEITGAVGLVATAIAVLSYGVPFLNALGFPITMGTASMLLRQAARVYPKLDTDERKQIRAVASFIKGGLNLSKFL